MNWKRIMLGSALLVTMACGDSDRNGASGGGGRGGDNDGGELDGGTGGDRDGGDGDRDGSGNIWGDSSEPSSDCDGLKATIRDFQNTHPDFQAFTGMGVTPGLVNGQLGPDRRPVYTGICEQGTSFTTTTCPHGAQTSGAAAFAQWYVDVPGVNQPFVVNLSLTKNGTEFVSDNQVFFPIDGRGWGDQGRDNNDVAHNFHFTTEVRTSFTYMGGERFTFRGDDDLWIFVNGKLALDLGGLHSVEEGTIDFDAQATSLGITKGVTYTMDIFHAERRTRESNFRIATNIACFLDPVI